MDLLSRLERRLRGGSEPQRRPVQPAPRVSLTEAASRIGWEPRRAERQLLRAVDSLMRRGRPRVGLMHPHDDRFENALLLAFPRARVVAVAAGLSRAQAHASLTAAGPFDLLVDLGGSRADRTRLFRDTFGHLAKRGAYVVQDCSTRLVAQGRKETVPPILGLLARLLDDGLQDASVRARPRSRHRNQDRALGRTIAEMTARRSHVVVTKGVRTLAKVREEDFLAMILDGVVEGTVLLQRPGAALVSRCDLHENVPNRDLFGGRELFPDHYQAPPLSLREVRGVTCRRGQVAVHESMLLPDSYRHHLARNLTNVRTTDISAFHAHLKGRPKGPKVLEGAFFHLSSEVPGHFGHAVTEQLSRLWAWDVAKRREPDLKALVLTGDPGLRMARWERDLYEAAGVAPADVHLTRAPVRVERFVSATPMLSMPAYIHPGIVEVWDRVARNLAAQATVCESPRRIFCSRRAAAKRKCRNSRQVEQAFVRWGFTVVYPEDLTLADQVALFQRADVVAGFAGSALLTLAFCEAPKRLISIQSGSYAASNEYLISAVRGHRMDRFWCVPDCARPDRSWDRAPFQSPFEFDFDRDGDRLEETLATL